MIDINEMIKDYIRGGKFADYVDRACDIYGDTVEEECQKAIVQEYYLSVVDKNGCNRERGSE